MKHSTSDATLKYTIHGFFFGYAGWDMHTIFMLNVFSASFPPILFAFLPGHIVQPLDLKQEYTQKTQPFQHRLWSCK